MQEHKTQHTMSSPTSPLTGRDYSPFTGKVWSGRKNDWTTVEKVTIERRGKNPETVCNFKITVHFKDGSSQVTRKPGRIYTTAILESFCVSGNVKEGIGRFLRFSNTGYKPQSPQAPKALGIWTIENLTGLEA